MAYFKDDDEIEWKVPTEIEKLEQEQKDLDEKRKKAYIDVLVDKLLKYKQFDWKFVKALIDQIESPVPRSTL